MSYGTTFFSHYKTASVNLSAAETISQTGYDCETHSLRFGADFDFKECMGLISSVNFREKERH
jgi:hypothetical protein